MVFGTTEFRPKKCLDLFPSEHMAKHTHCLIGDKAYLQTTATDGRHDLGSSVHFYGLDWPLSME
jgi:hypothetical protein